MLEKLFSLLLHAKGGALATVLVIGASGALVTATVENGMTTVTVTQPSSTTDGSPATTPADTTTTTTTVSTNPVILALFGRTKAEEDPTSPATGANDCSDAAKAANEQVKRVNDAAKADQQAVLDLGKTAPRTDAARKLVKDADKAIQGIRQAAVKAIHATFTCAKGDDEDNNKDEDNDDEDDDNGSTTGGALTGAATSTTATTTGPSVAFSGDNAKAIADLAISAMDLKVTNLKTALDALPATDPKSDKDKSENDKSDKAKTNSTKTTKDIHDNKGKGGDKGQHENDD
jgi:hypothetical protein